VSKKKLRIKNKDICKIDESLKNEFICIRNNQLPIDETVNFIRNIAEQEKLTITDEMIRIIQKMYQSDIRSMINFLQLHQHENNWNDYVYDDILWEELHILFSTNLENNKPIENWIYNITTHSGIMDIKTCIQHFFNYLIINKKDIVSTQLLNIAENLLHFVDIHDYMIPYFITQMNDLYKNYEWNKK
jgi:DNA polymerase III delta prime subunit